MHGNRETRLRTDADVTGYVPLRDRAFDDLQLVESFQRLEVPDRKSRIRQATIEIHVNRRAVRQDVFESLELPDHISPWTPLQLEAGVAERNGEASFSDPFVLVEVEAPP